MFSIHHSSLITHHFLYLHFSSIPSFSIFQTAKLLQKFFFLRFA